jgi:hypothetical protein
MGRLARTREFLPSHFVQLKSDTNISQPWQALPRLLSSRIVAFYAASSHVPHEASKAEKRNRLCKSIVMTMTNEQRKTQREKRRS